ncbi:MAG: nucleoside hydrolase [Myxococcota bacterium]|nr:nucleoside hydrolase [Myxococcota bacterium]
MSSLRIWIDTDPALGYAENDNPKDVDDAFAIAEAIGDEHVLVAGISSVFGNSPADVGFRVASELVRLTRANVGVVEGAAAAGSPDAGFPRNAAAVAMAEALHEAPLSIVAIGPLTNVAALIQHFPDEATRIEQVVVVAGRSVGQIFELNGAKGVPDFNFECDPHAARMLMESDVQVALTGFELTSQVVVTREQIESLRGRSRVADAIVDGALPWLTWWQGVFPSEAGFHPWDSAALAYLTQPELFVREQRGWRIGASPEGTPWLELGSDLPGTRATYCPGFAPGGAEAFVREMLAGVP